MWRVAVGLFLAGLTSAEVRSVCLDDRVGLNSFSRKAFEAEVRELIPVHGLTLTFGRCLGPAVSIVISAHPPASDARALGLAHRSGDRVLPALSIYTQPVLKIIGEQASAAQLGRALARVAAHELGHYLLQQIHHNHEGLMRASFESSELGSEDSSRFRQRSANASTEELSLP